MSRRRFISGSAVVAGSNGLIAAATFARSIIFARILGPENMGVAALALAVFGLLGLLTDIGFEKLLVQSPKGESPVLQGAAHLLAVLRGAVCAGAVYLIASPVMNLLGEGESADALGLLAGVFLIRGLAHADKWRYQRDLRFGPSATIDMAGVILSLAAAPVLSIWLGDFRAVVLALVIQGTAEMIASHLVAERKYRWSRDRECLSELWAFGLPLLLAGVMTFAAMQGDRFIVASLFTKEQLGVYAVAFGLAQIPVLAMGRVTTTVFLPSLAAAREQPERFRRRLAMCSEAQAVLGLAMCVPMVLIGTTLMVWLYGEEYASGGVLLGWLAVGQAARLMRSATAVAALAFGDSKNSMVANAARSLGLVIVLACAAAMGTLTSVGIGIVLGEAFAIAVSLRRLRREQAIAPMLILRPMLLATLVGALVVLAGGAVLAQGHIGLFGQLAVAAFATALAVGASALAMPQLRAEGRGAIAFLRARKVGS
jgi:O-antigen/teichoic acid export membrane protein